MHAKSAERCSKEKLFINNITLTECSGGRRTLVLMGILLSNLPFALAFALLRVRCRPWCTWQPKKEWTQRTQWRHKEHGATLRPLRETSRDLRLIITSKGTAKDAKEIHAKTAERCSKEKLFINNITGHDQYKPSKNLLQPITGNFC